VTVAFGDVAGAGRLPTATEGYHPGWRRLPKVDVG